MPDGRNGNVWAGCLSVEIHKEAEVCAIGRNDRQQPQIKHTNRFIKFVLVFYGVGRIASLSSTL